MGLKLGDLLKENRKTLQIEKLSRKIIGIDAYNVIYAFLSSIRDFGSGGELFTDQEGHVTSHLIGLTGRLSYMLSSGMKPVFIFDGKPPSFKREEVQRRREMKKKAEKLRQEALARDDLETAAKYATRTTRMTKEIVEDTKRLLNAYGIPVIQAPSEAEAQISYMNSVTKEVWATASQDYDAILFGARRIIRNLSIRQRRRTHDKKTIEVPTEIIITKRVFETLEISREQFILLALLIGTDYNDKGVPKVGPKTALKLVRKFPTLDVLEPYIHEKYLTTPELVQKAFPYPIEDLYDYFLNPEVSEDYTMSFTPPDTEQIVEFLAGERGFDKDRLERQLKKQRTRKVSAAKLNKFF